MPGLQEIERYAGRCHELKFSQHRKVLGIPDIVHFSSPIFVKSHIECSEIFGELYVFLACSNLCSQSSIRCPINFTAIAGTCLNYPADKTVLSLAENGKLALAIKYRKSYNQEIFACKNGHCTTFDRVCNLADDCGDLSDEEGCFNNFKCNESGEYIPLTSKCDGRFDCFDYSDECNHECNNQVNMFNHILYKVIAWIIGVLATVLNTFTLIHGICQYQKLENEVAKTNKVFVLLISLGDLLQGIFLLSLAVGDEFFNKSTCKTQFEWTTSKMCTFLGVISTIGSLVSLYSMTFLSIIRVYKVQNLIRPKETLSRRKTAYLSALVLTIAALSALIAIIPIIIFEDYFVENLIYEDNPLLVGAPDKRIHLKLVDSYYGRIHGGFKENLAISWNQIRYLVMELFANKAIRGKSIDFYGSNGFCLFSYFVRTQTSFKWYSIFSLVLNFICVLVIVICYIIITVISAKSSKSVSNNPQTEKKQQNTSKKDNNNNHDRYPHLVAFNHSLHNKLH